MPDTLQNDKSVYVRHRLAGIVTLGALGIALVHLIWPKVAIDGITIALFAIAVVPWLAPLFKTLELPGGWKFEFQEAQKLANQVEKVKESEETKQVQTKMGHITADAVLRRETNTWPIDYTDPNLALASLRIEIEKGIRTLAQKHGVPTERVPISRLLPQLADMGVLDKIALAVLGQTINVLNRAVHGEKFDPQAAELILTSAGPNLLKSLDILNSRPLGSTP